MKKIFTSLAVASIAAVAAFSASAQAGTDAPAVIQKVSLSYDLNTLYPKGADNSYFNGFGVGYNVDFKVSKSLPLYVGTGLELRTVFNSREILDDDEYNLFDVDANTTFMNLNLPVNVSYRVPVADNFYLTPSVGLDFRVQVYGHTKIDMEDVSTVSPQYPYVVAQEKNGINLFDKSDMGGDNLRRFQMGWHAGLNFEYSRFNLGLSYGTDFVKLHKDLGGSNFLVSLGYTF